MSDLLKAQLRSALEVDACFCARCGQPDEIDLHDREQCQNYKPGEPSVAMALDFFDQIQDDLPDDRNEAILGTFMKLYRRPTTIQPEGIN
jgi:hypothetical protein